MKKVYLIHGWGGSSECLESGWFSYLKKNLIENGIEFHIFDMPDTNHPKIDSWVGFLEKNIKNVDEETYFVGHSIGCQTIMRYLEKLPKNVKIGGCVFVAGWFNLTDLTYESKEDEKIAKPWLETPINFEKIKKHCNKFLAIFSDNDPYVPLSDSELFKKNLNAQIIIKKRQGHFNNVQEIQDILYFVGD